MEYFHAQMTKAATLYSWTKGGMAVDHLLHYLRNTGEDYFPAMHAILRSPVIKPAYEELQTRALEFARDHPDRLPGSPRHFRSTSIWQISPSPRRFNDNEHLRDQDVWYSLGVFVAWVDGQIAPDGRLRLRVHLLDHYDWDRDGVVVPIPQALCDRADSLVGEALVKTMVSRLQQYGRLDLKDCQVRLDDTVMHELHLQGFAKNYVTYGYETTELPL